MTQAILIMLQPTQRAVDVESLRDLQAFRVRVRVFSTPKQSPRLPTRSQRKPLGRKTEIPI